MEPFCSTLLDFTIETVTDIAETTTSPLVTVEGPAVVTETDLVPAPPITASPVSTGDYPAGSLPVSLSLSLDLDAEADIPIIPLVRRQNEVVPTPTGLQAYEPAVVTAACSSAATSPTEVVTNTITSTITAPAEETIVATTTVTTTTTATSVPACQSGGSAISGTSRCSCEYDVRCGGFQNPICNVRLGTYRSLAACVQACDHFNGCVGVNYNRPSGLCTVCNGGLLDVVNPVLSFTSLNLNPAFANENTAAVRRDNSCSGGLASPLCLD